MVSPVNSFEAVRSSIPDSVDSIEHLRRCKDKDEQLKKTAQEFESVFTNQLLTVMDSTIDRDQDGLFKQGRYEKQFRSMLNQYVAKDISTNPNTSLGLAKQMYEQMKDKI